MLESVIAYILRSYLGEYLENVATDQLSFLLLSGCVEIENLPVKTDGIRKLRLPIGIKGGFVSKLKLKIPLSAMKSQPWEVVIQGLYVIIEPEELAKINEEDEIQFEKANKMKRLKKMEESWKEEQKQQNSDGSWTSKLFATILENLQVSIEQVHIRYEERNSADLPYSLGVRIAKLAAHSTDENWNQNFTSNRAKSWKLVELTNLEVYTDNISHHNITFLPLDLPHIMDSLGLIQDSNIPYKGPGKCSHHDKLYSFSSLLEPVSCRAKVIRNRNPHPLQIDNGPRYQLYIELPNVKMSLSKLQYQSFIGTGNAFDMYYRSIAVRKWRPDVPVKENPRAWWHFAVKVHQTRISERNYRKSWEFILNRVSTIIFYTKTYKQYLLGSVWLDSTQQSKLAAIEDELSYDEISILRRIVMSQVEEILLADGSNSGSVYSNYASYWSSWLPSNWGGAPTLSEAPSKAASPDQISSELPNFSRSEFEEELDEFLELDSQTSNSFLFRDHQFASACFSMQEGSLSLYDPSNTIQGIIDMNFSHLKLVMAVRPRINYYRFDLSLASIQILDKHHLTSFFPVLVGPIRTKSCSASELFSLCIVKRKSKKFADLSISGRSQPLEAICNMNIVSLLQEFFKLPFIPSGSNLEENLTHIMREKIKALKSYTMKEIRPVIAEALQDDRWWSSKHLNLDLEISAPLFVLPEDFWLEESRAIIIDLGLFSLKTLQENNVVSSSMELDNESDDDFGTPVGTITPQELPTSPANKTDAFEEYFTKVVLNTLYDRYQLDVKNLQILVTNNYNSESCKLAYNQSSTPLHVLDKLTVSLQLCRRLRFTCDPSESNIAITGALPRLDIHIDEAKFNTILRIQENFMKTLINNPRKHSTTVVTIPKITSHVDCSPSKQMSTSILWVQDQNYSWDVEKKNFLMETKLLDASFTLQEVTLSFSHHNRTIIQLRVPGIQLTHIQRPYDYNQSLSIQDVFVADVLQRFGTQYELLIYSQGREKYYSEENGNLIYSSSISHIDKSVSNEMFYSIAQDKVCESNALLKLDRQVIFKESPNSKYPYDIVKINAAFTSLDIIANQETLVELLAFFNSLPIQNINKQPIHIQDTQVVAQTQPDPDQTLTEMSAKFQCLTAKFVCSEGPNDLKEVGIIRGYGLNLELVAHEEISMTGHLRGISLESIMENDVNHKRLLSVGQLDQSSSENNIENAFNFKVLYKSLSKQLALDFELASVHYTHSSIFLSSVQQCFSEFQYYFTRARESLESAAKDMAYSLFHKVESLEPLSPENTPTNVFVDNIQISYNILVNAPTLQLENQENCADKFIFNLGEITITNRSASNNNPNFEHIIISVRNVFMLAKIQNQSYRILENTNSKISVVRKLNTSVSMLECEFLSEIPIPDFNISPQVELVIFSNFDEDIQVTLHKMCFDTLMEILQQNSNPSKTLLTAKSVSESQILGSDTVIEDEDFKSIFFWAGCQIHNITLTISQDIGLETKKIVAFSTSDFSASIYQEQPYLYTIDTKLGGVRGYDLLNDKKRTFLVTSYLQDYTTYPEAFCQYSTLPETISYKSPLRAYELSLNEINISSHKPEQPPLKTQDLVSTKITLVDSNHPEYSNVYQDIPTHATINMNHIHIIINLQTWVLLLDFFDITPHNDNLITPLPSVIKSPILSPQPLIPFKPLSSLSPLSSQVFTEYSIPPLPLRDPDEDEIISIPASACSSVRSNSIPLNNRSKFSIMVDVSINSLIAIFNKSIYPLTCNSATGFKSSIKMEKGDVNIVGELGKASLIDLSPHGELYREKFVTHGENALYFEFFKYGESDNNLVREFDMRANFRMASVRYVHTKRFMNENLAFCQHFFQLIDAFQRMKANSNGNVSFSGPERHPRIKLDVSAASPIIFIPSHGLSPYLFIGELGHITVSNVFLFDGRKGTWTQRNRNSPYRSPEKSYKVSPLHIKEHSLIEDSQYKGPCLLDLMRIELQGNDVFTAMFDVENSVFVREDSKILKEKLNYRVVFEHNLHMPMCHTVPNFRFEIYISDSHCMLDKKQMDAFKTFLGKNLGEDLGEFERPTSVIRDPIVFEDFEDRWVELSFCFNFQHVCLEFVSSRATHKDDIDQFLSRFYMHNTTLQIELYSDSTKDIDFISREMSIVDVRYDDYVESQKPSIYRKVLLTRNAFENDPSTSSLQVEVHVKLNPQRMEYTIILNNLRMIFMMDLALLCWSFVADSSEEFHHLFDIPKLPKHSTLSSSMQSPPSQKSRDLQIKVSVTETDFVIIEDLTSPDSQALVCKGITVMTFTSNPTYEFTWNMHGVELFSCCFASEEETALSIIDPLNITIEIPRNHKLCHSYPLHIEVQTVNTRLSYNDMKLFAAIFKSISSILHVHQMSSSSYETPENTMAESNVIDSSTRPDIFDSYVMVEKVPKAKLREKSNEKKSEHSTFGEITVHINEFKLVLIDDCGNCDIPLGELNVDHLSVIQSLYPPYIGHSNVKLATNYYNRNNSAWEPLVEPFKVTSEWKREIKSKLARGEEDVRYPYYTYTLLSDEIILLNFTSSFLDILKDTQSSWGEDLTQSIDQQPLGLPMTGSMSNQGKLQSHGSATQLSSLAVRSISGFNFRKRKPFIPFRLENNTGLPLRFATLTKNPYKVSHHSSMLYEPSMHYLNSELRGWLDVPAGSSLSFAFEKKSKIRHQHLQIKTIHLLVVEVEGWKETKTPVSADQVGIVFRDLKPRNTSYPSVKLIFSIKLDGAQKVINVRTPIAVKNELKFEMEIKLTGELPNQTTHEFSLKPDCFASIPLNRQQSNIFIRPRGWGAQYPSHPLNLDAVERSDLWRVCVPFGPKDHKAHKQSFIYTYSVTEIRKAGLTSTPLVFKTIMLTHPFIIENLLPHDISVEICDLNQTKNIKPGASMPIISFTPSRGFSFYLHMDNFQPSHKINISPFYSESPTVQHEIIRDVDNRQLQLTVSVSVEKCPARKISIMAPYWLINRSNLPLIFREDNSESEAAGQFQAHETARSIIALPFSFISSDATVAQCQMRLGKSPLIPDGRPSWSGNFRLHSQGGVVLLYVLVSSNTVPIEYQLAVEITKGSGKYKDISMVTFINRFQLENLTSLPIRYLQNCQFENDHELIEFTDSTKQIIMPNSITSFNWPRSDRDNFLRVKYEEIAGVFWSGPFKVVEEDTFVLSLKSKEDNLYFIRVNIRQKNYAYIIRFSDTQNIPPPFIIQNYSQVPIYYIQRSIALSHKHCIKPGQSKAYAWDEILSEQKLKIFVDDIDQNVIYDPVIQSEQHKLGYENFFYIALYDTFCKESPIPGEQLVLSIEPKTHKVIFTRKSNHHSQQWRMTGAGRIQHVSSLKQGYNLVLDINDSRKSGILSAACIPLVLKDKDEKRDLTQKWEFNDGLLTLANPPHQCVCAKMVSVSVLPYDAVLVANPKAVHSLKEGLSLPPNHHIRTLKCKPGSGMLSVRISTKGPSNIIRITDNNPIYHHLNISPHNWNKPESKVNSIMKLLIDEESLGSPYEFLFICESMKGIGLSLISNGEELTYNSFDNVIALYKRTNKSEIFEINIADVQVDDQTAGIHTNTIFYVEDSEDNRKQAFSISLERLFDSSPGFYFFKFLHIQLKNYVLTIDERILFKLLLLFGLGQMSSSDQQPSSDLIRTFPIENPSDTKYFYFRDIFIDSTKLNTSVITVSNLSPQLQAIKSQLGIKMVKFQATISLTDYQRKHNFDRLQEHIASICYHYKTCLTGQALKVLGSVDFLGNPVGLFNDLTKGITGLIMFRHGFSGLLRDVTHGLSDSTSKLTGSAGNLVSYMTFDKQYQKEREDLNPVLASSAQHLGAGLNSFASGMFGGITSIITSPYQGAQDGLLGFMTGVGKGVVGTIAKPIAGTLDLVSNTSAALRVQTLSSNEPHERKRLPRCCAGAGGVLPIYTGRSAKGVHYFSQFCEWESAGGSFISLEDVRHDTNEYIQVVISTCALYFINVTRKQKNLLTTDVQVIIRLSRLKSINICSKPMACDKDHIVYLHHLEFEVLYDDDKPKIYQIPCHSHEVAIKLNQIVEYAKHLREEEKQVIPTTSFEDYW
ncbi:vacuolar protein sorting-associated protein 13D [Oopsacas minuta]|uniref:Vacuolar protein sorting-associated protein 13D n=1 Tax=Oopsacas minuta TaxID=111878 RepID=A0AAV7JX68_9METZ|nr:vacuolar protein sorting-associated protein 13D [Oopsacas minuta]